MGKSWRWHPSASLTVVSSLLACDSKLVELEDADDDTASPWRRWRGYLRVLTKMTMLKVSETLEELESADSSAVVCLDTLEQVIHLYSCHLSIILTSTRLFWCLLVPNSLHMRILDFHLFPKDFTVWHRWLQTLHQWSSTTVKSIHQNRPNSWTSNAIMMPFKI